MTGSIVEPCHDSCSLVRYDETLRESLSDSFIQCQEVL